MPLIFILIGIIHLDLHSILIFALSTSGSLLSCSSALKRVDNIAINNWVFWRAVTFNRLLSRHKLLKNCCSTLCKMTFKFTWTNNWRIWFGNLNKSVLSYRTFTRTTMSSWATVDYWTIFTLSHVTFTFSFFIIWEVYSFYLKRIYCPSFWVVFCAMSLMRWWVLF